MAIIPVRLAPDPLLRRKAKAVSIIDDAIRKLARDMIETLVDARGAGLSGNQVGVLKRIIALNMPDEDPYALINPEIIFQDGKRHVQEGCLSFPGYVGLVDRAEIVKATALTVDGQEKQITATDLLAQALEHEIDHLNGILFIDHVQAHDELWKLGVESGPHGHDEVDFESEAAHERTLTPAERLLVMKDEGIIEEESADHHEEPGIERIYGHFLPEQLDRVANIVSNLRNQLSDKQ